VSAEEKKAGPGDFIEKDGLTYMGIGLCIDLWEARDLDNMAKMRATLLDCVAAAGARLRDLDLFQFGEGGGIAGVAMLIESHISVHTWPEHSYGAFDAFLCGKTHPYRIVPVLKGAFRPGQVQVTEHKRGLRF
jgi:S-adenosylmethionine decarboxylase